MILSAAINRLRYHLVTKRVKPARYRNLYRLIHEHGYRRLVEVGVWNGKTAERMINTAAAKFPPKEIQYFGFDLWEQLTDSLFQTELSKRPPAKEFVRARLARTGAQVELIQGNTQETLGPAVVRIGSADLVFIDGGHSVETVRSDWNNARDLMRPGSSVVFDDYYTNPSPEIAGKGCQDLIDSLDRTVYATELLEPVDVFQHPWGELRTQFVRVSLRS